MPLAALSHTGSTVARRALWSVRRKAGAARSQLVLRRASRELGPQLLRAENPIAADVVVHFAEAPDRAYQLDQWLPVLEGLAQRRRVLLVLRDMRTLRVVAARTTLPVVGVPSFHGLIGLYERNQFKLGIYVNNGDRNFQSLSNSRMLHVHVGHGDSDKVSSFSNQAKAYDRVFAAGPVAARRYSEGLMAFDERKIVMVGRPQLDLSFTDPLVQSARRTMLYAPTWEGATESNNWTSVDCYGPRIAEAALALPDVRLVYKPHPRIEGSRSAAVGRAHQSILRQIESANARDPEAGHVAVTEGNILSMFAGCDMLVGDVSSVCLDFLYLRADRPILLTDRGSDREKLEAASPLAAATDVIDETTIDSLPGVLASRLEHDALGEKRAAVRAAYFGELAPGASMVAFVDAIDSLVDCRDELIALRAPG